ncbi:MAG: PAS domain S-box protein [Ginsengibacter sp.]
MNEVNFENHFKDLFHNTTDLIQFVKIDGNIELVNDTWLSILEYELHEVIGRSIYDFIHPDYAGIHKENSHTVILTMQTLNVETVFISKYGKTVFVEGNLNAFAHSDKAVYTRAVFKDITERRLAEKKLAESERRLNILFKRAPDAVVIINEHQKIIEWNPKAETIFGFTAGEVLGKLLSDTIIPVNYREAHKNGMMHFLRTGEGPVLNKTIEITALHKTGREFYINLSISSVKIETEWLFIAFLSDISERKKTEEALIRKEAELIQAKSLEQQKNEFLSIASHELKTPLTTIKAYTQVALACCADTPDKVTEYLKKVDEFSNKLNSLVTELLDISRIDAGKLKITTKRIDMSVFLEDILSSLQYITSNHTIIFNEKAHALVNIDQLRLEQVISNIIDNASKYSPGKNEIVVTSQIKNDQVITSFKDFGIGIPEQNLPKIFNRFYRVNEASMQFSGLGIGLFISSEIVKQHGGEIWVESELNKGSTFYFSLPIVQ